MVSLCFIVCVLAVLTSNYYICASPFLCKRSFFLSDPHHLWRIKIFCFFFNIDHWLLLGDVGWRQPIQHWVFKGFSIYACCPALGFCICYHQFQEEASLMKVEQGTKNPWIWCCWILINLGYLFFKKSRW